MIWRVANRAPRLFHRLPPYYERPVPARVRTALPLAKVKQPAVRGYAIINYATRTEVPTKMQSQVLEGQWEDIVSRNSAQLAGRKVRITIEPDQGESVAPTFPPNEQALAMLRDLARLQEGMKETDGSQTDQLLREARAGGVYGLKLCE